MFGSNILDVAIGLVSLFLLLSLMATAVNELIETVIRQRAKNLEKGIIELVGSRHAGTFVSDIYNHGLINSLFHGNYGSTPTKDLPSYIPSRNFALAMIDLTKNPPTDAVLPDNIRTALETLRATAAGDADKLQKSVEDWYNSAMDRVSGWYKRRSQYFVFFIGLALAGIANADCIDYAKRLSSDASLRQSVVAFAEATAKTNPTKDDNTPAIDKIKSEMHSLNGIGLPIGWEGIEWGWNSTSVERPFGWLLTALAVSLGAPFWFDMLNKIMVVRSTVKPHEKSNEEGSKDLSGKKTSGSGGGSIGETTGGKT
jgi:hypothetical protein